MTDILHPDQKQLAKWRVESARAAAQLKRQAETHQADEMVAGFVFNDAFIKVTLKTAQIRATNVPTLAITLYEEVVSCTAEMARKAAN